MARFDPDALVRRRSTRGRPRKLDTLNRASPEYMNVYIARDPQGIKLFTVEPELDGGVWVGKCVPDTITMTPKMFIAKFRNAVLPMRGKWITANLEK